MPRTILTLLLAWLAAAPALAEYSELTALKEFSRQTLDVYAKRLTSVDKKFEGVVNFGKSLASLPKAKEINVADLTYRSKDYWRATMEMVPSDPSVLFAHAYLHAAKGETALANIYFMLGSLNMDKNIQGELDAYQAVEAKLNQRLKAEMQKGIDLHDKGEFDKALDVYDAVLAEHPNCAWAYYEKGYAYLAMGPFDPAYETKRTKMYQECRTRDPFYGLAYQGRDPAVIRKFLVFGQKVEPYTSGRTRNGKTLTAFAEGCEEMEIYPPAAHVRWKLAGLDTKNTKTHLRKLLDLIEKCGCKETAFFRAQFVLSDPAPEKAAPKEASAR